MQRKLRILVDMDGVVAKFNWKVAEKWDQLYPQFPSIPAETLPKFDTATCYADVYGDWSHQAVKDIYQGKDFFNELDIMPGAVEALHSMLKAGHDVFFCTAPVGKHSPCVSDKFGWVEKHFGKEWVRRIVLTSDKTFISGDVLIDDKPGIKGCQNPPLWKQVYFTQPYNKDCKGPRINEWSEWESVLSSI